MCGINSNRKPKLFSFINSIRFCWTRKTSCTHRAFLQLMKRYYPGSLHHNKLVRYHNHRCTIKYNLVRGFFFKQMCDFSLSFEFVVGKSISYITFQPPLLAEISTGAKAQPHTKTFHGYSWLHWTTGRIPVCPTVLYPVAIKLMVLLYF